MPKDENSISSTNGASPTGRVDPAERAAVDAQQARFAELHEQFVAEGGDSSKQYEKLLAKAATWSR